MILVIPVPFHLDAKGQDSQIITAASKNLKYAVGSRAVPHIRAGGSDRAGGAMALPLLGPMIH